MTKLIYFISLLIILSSCVNQRSVAKWIKKNGGEVTIDSVFVHDTLIFITERIETDTIFKALEGDTVYINKDKLRIKYVNLPGDSVYIEGIVEADTVTIYKDRWVGNKLSIVDPPSRWDKFKSDITYFLILLLITYIIFTYLKSRRNKVPPK